MLLILFIVFTLHYIYIYMMVLQDWLQNLSECNMSFLIFQPPYLLSVSHVVRSHGFMWDRDKMDPISQAIFWNAFFLYENVWFPIKIPLKFVPNGTNNIVYICMLFIHVGVIHSLT